MKQPDFKSYGIVQALPSAEFRPYREEDYEAVCAFLIALNKKKSRISIGIGRALSG